MNSPEFTLLLFQEWDIMLIAVLIVMFFYFILFRKYILSIFDPLLFNLFFSTIGASTMLFLYIIGKRECKYFLFYLLTQTAFFIGFIFFRPISIKTKYNKENKTYNMLAIKYFYLISSVLLFLFQLFIYVFKGIPLFMESRLNVIGNDTLFKIYNRLRDVFYIPVVLLMFYFIFTKKNKKLKFYSFFILFFVVISNILNGAKSALINIVLIYFIYSLFSLRMSNQIPLNLLKKHTKKIFVFALLGAVVVVSEKTDNAFFFILYRILIGGDSYFMTFPYGTIEYFVARDNWFINLFASPLSLLGIIPSSEIPPSLGFDIMAYHYKAFLFKGPNPRHNILGYVYIGYYGAILFSFILGLLLGFIRNKLYKLLTAGPIGLVIYGSFLFSVLMLETDFYNGLASLINSFICLFFIYISYILSKVQKNDINCYHPHI